MPQLIRRFPEEPESSEDVFLIAVSDLAWNLVVVFIAVCASMIADATARLRELDLQMGKTSTGTTSTSSEPPTATVTISANGDVAVDGRILGKVTEIDEMLVEKLRDSGSQNSGKCKVWVIPDRGASWEHVSKVHDVVSQSTDDFVVIAQEENQK
jgi:biopolymer transport protein ExbD